MKNLKIINVTRNQFIIFLLYIATMLFSSIGIFVLMLKSTGNEWNTYVFLSKENWQISLFLPLFFLVVFSVVSLSILMFGNEQYEFSEQTKKNTKKLSIYLGLIEIAQMLVWILILLILITYFYPVDQGYESIYWNLKNNTDWNRDKLSNGLGSVIAINYNLFQDLKTSLIRYSVLFSYFYNRDSMIAWNIVYLVLYLSLFLTYFKLSLFKKKLKWLALIPFIGFIIYMNESSEINLKSVNEKNESYKWY
ncbi:hypothetical protein [Mycoplasma bradburyae]|uniref:hypothetical protein n=1 Tax=Mycoplasma bradburyae TaxID=2963128 RepID=UPI002340581C|nr:hypothetical protein [Mycoplasma bradburyae]MDC4184386.1 hypothetical protein [Mycoplasma bradburyae]